MPIYEFYCATCHTVFNFLSRGVNVTKHPACPRCGRPRLERRMSSFAISKGRAEGEGGGEGMPDIDEARMERAMAEIAHEAEGLGEEDPRRMARLMRKLYDSTGLSLGEGVEEAIRRMENGEDPEKIEEELGGILGAEDPFLGTGPPGKLAGALRRRLRPPSVDDTLYEL
jgi:putative FmdB family regulatory protein